MKKTTFKRIAASIAALCICSMAVAPVVASAGTITIKGGTDTITVAGKTFEAYKIFDVKKNEAGTSYNYTVVEAWKSTVIAALNSIIEGTENYLPADADSEVIATALNKYKVVQPAADATEEEKAAIEATNTANAASVQAFAQYLAKNIPAGVTAAGSATGADGATTTNISVTDPGYYMVLDTTGNKTGSAISAVMLNTAADTAEVSLKVDAPTIEKKIVEGDGLYEANTANMYETVNYKVTSAVPDHTHYTKYFFVMEDTIEEGLTFNKDVKATIGGTTVDVQVGYQDRDGDGHEEYMTITFPDLKGYAEDAAVEVTYSAKVNLNAHVGAEGNVNGIKLNYSNKPTQSGNGLRDTDGDDIPDKWDETPGTPEDGTPEDDSTSDTTEEKVITYLTQFDINKVDGSGNALDGAGFTIYTSETGTDAVKFSMGTATKGTADTTDDEVVYCVDANGSITEIPAGSAIIYGLDEDTHYWIEETKWPDGFNPIEGRIEFEVLEATINGTTNILDANYTYVDTDKAKATWTYLVTASDTDVNGGAATSNSNSITVANQAGSLFPSTGGIGTTIFTVVGVTLMAGAAGAFAIKRKAMNK